MAGWLAFFGSCAVLRYRIGIFLVTSVVTITSSKQPAIVPPIRGQAMKPPTTLQRKRSISVSGHRTSISLEDEFWNCLREIAEQHGEMSKLVSDINAERQFANLSSAIRMYVLRHYRDLVDQKDRTIAPINGSSIEAW